MTTELKPKLKPIEWIQGVYGSVFNSTLTDEPFKIEGLGMGMTKDLQAIEKGMDAAFQETYSLTSNAYASFTRSGDFKTFIEKAGKPFLSPYETKEGAKKELVAFLESDASGKFIDVFHARNPKMIKSYKVFKDEIRDDYTGEIRDDYTAGALQAFYCTPRLDGDGMPLAFPNSGMLDLLAFAKLEYNHENLFFMVEYDRFKMLRAQKRDRTALLQFLETVFPDFIHPNATKYRINVSSKTRSACFPDSTWTREKLISFKQLVDGVEHQGLPWAQAGLLSVDIGTSRSSSSSGSSSSSRREGTTTPRYHQSRGTPKTKYQHANTSEGPGAEDDRIVSMLKKDVEDGRQLAETLEEHMEDLQVQIKEQRQIVGKKVAEIRRRRNFLERKEKQSKGYSGRKNHYNAVGANDGGIFWT
mmetsp:Transcript_25211/g.37237  ORF Transcript_25211/g.37237 Transcript_25211/m.37237 type:complete len:415 (-) Transcript_25211:77-1321(-)|eukprot:CAMPEP_0194210554 /NCGR_PEP_ID=MMETSP0156-20130528/8724_1 /TAXON_ID=33649 /ORGANISM="Thalassionema nitzschioides, Strain L26-B" /LENGTH=414 /DNA_ID=CAMNT_0038937915 /DNA_START=60 /DNA_END=1304 /DNA_ORIENTATION=+